MHGAVIGRRQHVCGHTLRFSDQGASFILRNPASLLARVWVGTELLLYDAQCRRDRVLGGR